jgi:hypothetical protein
MDTTKLIAAIPDKNSSDQYWIAWHGDMKKMFGKEKANEAFIVAFAYRASSAAKTKTLFNYGKTQGLDLETNLIGDAGRIIQGVEKGISGITGKIGKIFKVGGTVITVMVILILIPVFMLLFNIAKEPNTAIGAASKGFAASHGM